MSNSGKKDSVMDVIGTVILFIFLGIEIVLVTYALFGGGGAESEVNRDIFMFSAILGLFGAIIILALKLGHYIVQHSNSYKKWGWINCVLHDPEDSPLLNQTGFKWLRSPFMMIGVFLILSSILGLVQVYQNSFWTELPSRVPQQITETAQGILSSIPSDMEVYVPLSIAGLLISVSIWLAKTNKIPTELSYVFIYIGVPVLYTITWIVYHFLHHSGSTIALQYVGLFGAISAILLVTFRSIIPIIILKITNNLYAYLNDTIQANETILLITVGINLLLIVLIFFIWTMTMSKKTEG